MIISILQPCFVPWLGYFEQIALADVFVYLDDVQYTKKDWRNNNQLKSPYGVKGISVPVIGASRETLINEARISTATDWRDTLLNQLREWYRKAPHYVEVMELVRPHFMAGHAKLVDLNHALNDEILSYLGIKTPIFYSSAIERKTNNKVDRILEICEHFPGVKTLYDGKKAQDFLDGSAFQSKGLKVVFQDYQHRPYPQLWGDFVPYMSVLDLLFNCGRDSLQYLVSSEIRREQKSVARVGAEYELG